MEHPRDFKLHFGVKRKRGGFRTIEVLTGCLEVDGKEH